MKYFIGIIMAMMMSASVADGVDTHNFGNDSLTSEGQYCYALGNIGFDTVINAREGVSLEQMYDLIAGDALYKMLLTMAIEGAYIWKYSPHEYGMYTYVNCMSFMDSLEKV